MGKLIEQTAQAAGDRVVCAMDLDNLDQLAAMDKTADVILDFSNPSAFALVEAYVRRTGTPLLSGTTGYSADQLARLRALGAYAPVLHSGNYSLGIAVFQRVLRQIAPTLLPDFDVEITETHHNQKVDAPSGTALALADSINEASDGAYHTLSFFGPDEELTITHRAASRQIFVNGALHMARILKDKPNGVYDLQALLFQN